MSKRLPLLCAATVATAVLATDVSLGLAGATAPGGTIPLAELPGHGWALPLQDEQLGRVAKAFAAAHEACSSTDGGQAVPASVRATFSARLGRGLSLAAGLVAV